MVLLGENMKKIAVSLLCLALTSCAGTRATVSDPIDSLVQRLNATRGMWINGTFPIIDLPPDATTDQVLAAAVKMTGFDQGHIKSFQIQEVRQLELIAAGRQTFSAALIDSDLGKKIFLFKPTKGNQWWTRFYNIEEKKQNK